MTERENNIAVFAEKASRKPKKSRKKGAIEADDAPPKGGSMLLFDRFAVRFELGIFGNSLPRSVSRTFGSGFCDLIAQPFPERQQTLRSDRRRWGRGFRGHFAGAPTIS